jgi:short-subunit dehydrogenase
MKNLNNKTIWIIGASTGIGAALAQKLAHKNVNLILSSRNAKSLENLAKSLSGSPHIIALDVTSEKSCQTASLQAFKLYKNIDSIIFLAGIYEPQSITDLDLKSSNHIIKTNLMGAVNLTYFTLPYLKKQKTSQLAFCASIAGYRGLPNAQIYGASKAALINFCESLYLEHKEIDIKLINPGFVKTRLTAKNNFSMPMLISPEKAAEKIIQGLSKKQFEISFPKNFTYICKLLRLLPYNIYFKIIRKLIS